ncbi:hypothetical protein ACFRI7_22360 [Streptomyces sp. NPDC056716]|uniref:hypothetical protein n=1 Tax=unclassified Streptomyces TaxID=2593676 RepID=UPI0036821822
MPIDPEHSPEATAVASSGDALRRRSRIEVIPLPSLGRRVGDLPPASRLSVTSSPAHGVGATIDATERLRGLGHDATPHLAARQVESRAQLADIVARCDAAGVTEVFFVGGDGKQPAGPYRGALDLAVDYAKASSVIDGFGFTAYPEGHGTIPGDALSKALDEKQAFVRSVNGYGYVSTQLCFSAATITAWARRERARGFTLPIRLGVPGHVDRIKLAAIAGRLGIGSSLGFLKKNRASVAKLMSAAHFEPTEIVDSVLDSDSGSELGVEGLHVFSFNNVAPTMTWFDRYLGSR